MRQLKPEKVYSIVRSRLNDEDSITIELALNMFLLIFCVNNNLPFETELDDLILLKEVCNFKEEDLLIEKNLEILKYELQFENYIPMRQAITALIDTYEKIKV